jgi:hypothetical protein
MVIHQKIYLLLVSIANAFTFCFLLYVPHLTCFTYRFPENQHKVGGCLLNLMPHFKSMYLAYCANHPSAVNVLTQHR